ncbi:MAG: hypothetical protein IPF72_19500 [Chitinophagaceae bacterium]|nr:hypothetical protein [Chitinophagaceae bacterium]
MINRRVTRVVLNTAEITSDLIKPNGSGVAMVLDTPDALYVGYHGKFASRYLQVGTVNSNTANLIAKYWDGAAWVDVDDFIDQTYVGGSTLGASGFISWANKDDWRARSLTGIDSDVSLYWIQLTVDATLSVGTTLSSILNIFSDDELLASYYPELVSDTRFLPSGKTNFLDQHLAAKDAVVLRLKQRAMIDDESQVIDANAVAIAAVHKAAHIIIQPIATSDVTRELAKEAKTAFDEEINRTSLRLDLDKDGEVSELESSEQVSVFYVRRG